jgi:hypothetical protein
MLFTDKLVKCEYPFPPQSLHLAFNFPCGHFLTTFGAAFVTVMRGASMTVSFGELLFIGISGIYSNSIWGEDFVPVARDASVTLTGSCSVIFNGSSGVLMPIELLICGKEPCLARSDLHSEKGQIDHLAIS